MGADAGEVGADGAETSVMLPSGDGALDGGANGAASGDGVVRHVAPNGHADGSNGSQRHAPAHVRPATLHTHATPASKSPDADTAVLETQGLSAPATSELAASPVSSASTAPDPVKETVPLSGASTPTTSPALLDASGVPIDRRVLTTAELTRIEQRRRKLNLQAMAVAMAALLALITAFYSPFFDPASSQPPRVPDPVPLAEVQPYGVNTFLHKEVETFKKEHTLDLARDLGVGWIRQQFPWAEIEYRANPNDPYFDVKNNQSAWLKYDGIVDLAEKYNLRIIARIDSAPIWSHPASGTLKSPPDKAHMADFANFIATFVNRYKGRIAAIQIWNEPNLTDEWVVTDAKGNKLPVSPADYTAMLKVAYDAAKNADPNMIVLSAPLATTNDTSSNLNEMAYLQGMYDAGAKTYFDAMSANAYGKSAPPEDPPSPDKLNFRRVELLHNVMAKNGDGNKSVWFNEYGWNASPPSMPQDQLRWGRVTPEQQADYTVRGIEYARKNWPWAGVFTIWYLRQVGDTTASASEYYFGMVNPDFVAAPVYKAVQAAAKSIEKVAMPGQWGPLSPAVQAPPTWRINLSAAAPGGAYVTPSRIGDALEFPFQGTDVKLTLVPPSATSSISGTVSARYFVTVDGSSDSVSPDLPRDEQHRAYIDLPGNGQVAELTVVRGLGAQFRTQKHLLRIEVGQGPEPSNNGQAVRKGPALYAPLDRSVALPGIAAVTVEVHSSYLLYAAVAALLLAGIAFCIWALTRGKPGAPGAATARGR